MFSKKLLGSALAVSLMLGSMGTASASEGEKVKAYDELWGQPTFAYGSGLTSDEVTKVKEIFELGEGDSIELPVSAKDMVRLIGVGNPNSNMYSSALIQGADNKGGISVEIVTPENITKVTESQYANALITAGASNVNVKVASPKPVTGESALTGIYVAYEDKGIELDEQGMAVAQEEIGVVTDIVEDSSDNENFNEEELNLALIQIKQQLAELKEKNGDDVSDEMVNSVVMGVLADNGLDEIISEENIQSLVSLSKKYLDVDALVSDEMQEQLGKLASDVTDKAKDLASKLGNKAMETLQDEGFWEGIKNFFNNLFDAIAGLFSKDDVDAVKE